eukprot:TRINITY_DN4590_c1_g3_i1.p1 TRINITY_DN4590_c1_g3~~TRINITY_DN4590_c1_g3_i1.p1  ORF type:complete len:696 (+),score=132.54 TRINITY_DN4590_c1_g3_i1:114-2090(+)
MAVAAVRSLCQAAVQFSLRHTDRPDDRRRKKLLTPLFLVVTPFSFFVAIQGIEHPTRPFFIGIVGVSLSNTFSLAWLFLARSFPGHLIGSVAAWSTFCIMVTDITNGARSAPLRSWVFAVLILDVLLVVRAPDRYQHIALLLTVVWVVIYNVEGGYRLGLYDIDGFTEDSRAWDACSCADPPCAAGIEALTFALPCLLLVLLGDFLCTRGFAEGLQAEQAKVLAAVEVSEQVAAGLAGFDLDTAARALSSPGSELPDRLSANFNQLLRNLASYRPYLPESCFETDPFENARSDDSSGSASTDSKGTESRASSSPSAAAAGATFSRVSASFGALGVRRSSTGDSSSRFPRGASQNGEQTGLLAVRGGHVPQQRRVTLLARNSSGFLGAVQGGLAVSPWLEAEVQGFTEVARAQGGVTDLLSGDHFSASFGAVKAQGSQRNSATRAARLLAVPHASAAAATAEALPSTAAVVHGRALCGDFGSEQMQRFMVVGGLGAFVVAAERAAAAWSASVLIDSAVHDDAEALWSCRLRKRVTFAKHSSKPIGLWEVTGDRMVDNNPEEWMYQLENAQPNQWQPYNRAVELWCDGAAAEALGLIQQQLSGVVGVDADLGGALLAVRDHLQRGASPPVGSLAAAALAGDPAPLVPQRTAPPVTQGWPQ